MGIAFISAICGRSGVGLTQDTRRSVDSVGGIMAHELGHLFGMNHDDGSEYTCTVFACALLECGVYFIVVRIPTFILILLHRNMQLSRPNKHLHHGWFFRFSSCNALEFM